MRTTPDKYTCIHYFMLFDPGARCMRFALVGLDVRALKLCNNDGHETAYVLAASEIENTLMPATVCACRGPFAIESGHHD